MKHGPFLQALAAAYRVPERTVIVYARALREGGLLTTGARGVNAPDMTALDAARMTLALLATDSPARAVEMVNRFSGIPLDAERSTIEPPQQLLTYLPRLETAKNLNVICAMTALFSCPIEFNGPGSGDGRLHFDEIEVRRNERVVQLRLSKGDLVFRDTQFSRSLHHADYRDRLGIQRNCSVSYREIMWIWPLLNCPELPEGRR